MSGKKYLQMSQMALQWPRTNCRILNWVGESRRRPVRHRWLTYSKSTDVLFSWVSFGCIAYVRHITQLPCAPIFAPIFFNLFQSSSRNWIPLFLKDHWCTWYKNIMPYDACREQWQLTTTVLKSGRVSLECSWEIRELTSFLSKKACVSNLISTAVACASSEFCKSSRKTVNSPEYRARILSIKARWLTSTDSSWPLAH